MKTAIFALLWSAFATAATLAGTAGLDPAKTIEADGSITLSDGSSYYTFSRGGAFTAGPLGLEGRHLDGSWTLSAEPVGSAEKFTVIARAGWMNQPPELNDCRRIVFLIGPGEKRPFRDHMVPAIVEFGAYLLIDEFVKIPPPH